MVLFTTIVNVLWDLIYAFPFFHTFLYFLKVRANFEFEADILFLQRQKKIFCQGNPHLFKSRLLVNMHNNQCWANSNSLSLKSRVRSKCLSFELSLTHFFKNERESSETQNLNSNSGSFTFLIAYIFILKDFPEDWEKRK